MWISMKRLLGNNRGNTFIENLLMILLVVLVIAIPTTDLSKAISNIIVDTVERVNQIGTP
mgnify:CR=1 FL=1